MEEIESKPAKIEEKTGEVSEIEMLKKLLDDIDQETVKVQIAVHETTFDPDLSSLKKLLTAFQKYDDREKKLRERLRVLDVIKDMLQKRLNVAEEARQTSKEQEILKKHSANLLEEEAKIMKALGNKSLDPLTKAELLQDLAGIKNQIKNSSRRLS
jgi:hypothetical protein